LSCRYPRVTWEFVLVPLVEAVVYGLGYSGADSHLPEPNKTAGTHE
jgi:hypothetical protein